MIHHFKLLPVLLIATAALLNSCNSAKSYNATTIGEMEDLIKKGDMTTHIALKDIQSAPHSYAIGSVTNLKGFIVVNDGKPYTSFVQGDSVAIDSSWNTAATLLVYAHAENWKEISIPAEVKNWKQLEDFVMTTAKENKINLDVAFPFLLKGRMVSVNWRVTDWDINDKEVTNKKVKNSGLKGEANDVNATIVGFYCTKQYRVLAEHSTKMHLHFVSDDKKVSGHADDIALDGNMKLYLPEEAGKE
ncbi:MAG: acetolactate decarboxylase [Chitinophagaceae bacterium]|nr:acetolactate decarboxylase [Chitinophagaceae bacterium]